MMNVKTSRLRVVILTQGKTRIVEPICNSRHTVAGIVECAPRNAQQPLSFAGRIKKNLSFLKQDPDKELARYAESKGIPFFYLEKSGMETFSTWLSALNADVMVVYSMSYLLPEKIFSIPVYGTINLHPSFLPQYPGRNPWFWAYYNTDLQPGVTLHYIDKGEDTGDIIRQERFDIALGTKSPELYDLSIGKVGVKLILQTLEELAEGKIVRIPQQRGTEYPKARQVKENESLIDFQTWSLERIWHLLRGTEIWYRPIPPPRGIHAGQRWIVKDFEKTVVSHEPGKIVKWKGSHSLVTKDGYIFLEPTRNKKIYIKRLLKIFNP